MRARLFPALGVALVVAACSRPGLPLHLAGLHRSRVWTGESAARLVTRMHGRDVAPHDSTVADYGARGELRVWLARYPDNGEAFGALEAMLRGIRSGGTGFAPPREQAGMPGRFFTFGPGGHHMLWVSGNRLYWLQGLPDAVQSAASELPAPATGQLT